MSQTRKSPELHDYQVRISDASVDPAWDAFLMATGGEYQQSTMWSRIKSGLSYQTRRILIEHGGAIIGGAQLLDRTLPVVGALGYVPLGPVLATNSATLARILVQRIRQLAKEERLRFVAVQVPGGSPAAGVLRDEGFTLSSPKLAPIATVVIDLSSDDQSNDLDGVFSQMGATTRKHIRRSERGGVTVREGTNADLATFQRLSSATAQRRGFKEASEDYLSRVWNEFAPHGNIRIFIAELAGEALSALIVIAFGASVTCWRMGWAGKQPGVYPNEAMHWAAMQWAKSRGYRRFDLGGIDLDFAKLIVAGETSHAHQAYRVDYFKLGFGGKVTIFPEPVGYAPNPVLRRAWPLLSTSMTRFRSGRFLLSRFIGRT